jgi:ribosomal protein S18 acetylase RimI-like enzyme
MTATVDVQPATADDATDILDLVLLCDIAEIGKPECTIDEVEEDLARTTLQAWVARDAGGVLQGYCWIEKRANHTEVIADVLIRPGGDPALAQRLLDHVRGTAREIEPSLALHMFAVPTNRMKSGMFEAAGATVVRHFWRMTIDLPDSPAPVVPAPSAGVQVRVADCGEADLRTMHRVINEAFLDHFGNQSSSYEDWAPSHTSGAWGDFSLWWLATVDGEPAAAQIGGWFQDEGGHIADLGTLREYRGRGLGRLLLLTAFAEFHRRGERRVNLGVDASNPTGAVALYESVGMHKHHETAVYEFAAPG